MTKRYPDEFKTAVVQRYMQGESIQTLSQEYQVSPSSIYKWRKPYRTICTPTTNYTPKDYDKLCAKLKKLENQMEILHLTGCLDLIPLQQKLAALEKLHNESSQYSIHELCGALDVARGTFYNHILRRKGNAAYEEEQARLKIAVQQAFDDSEQRFGAEKIRAILAANGIQASKRRVSAIMQELGLRSVRPDAKYQYQKQQQKQAQKKNLLKNNFTAQYPNQYWVGDFTYFRVSNYTLYFCVVLDLFSRKIVGYHVSHNPSTRLVTVAFQRAFESRGCPKDLTFHSDRGTQYTSKSFCKFLADNGVTQSFSASRRPTDNAVSETFFASFKKEEAYRRNYSSERMFLNSVERYVNFYNNLRPHQTLNYKIPQNFEDAYYSKNSKDPCSKHESL